ncbi:hypothetical protein BC831DRAFT_446526 [Entophlyctis helioformis]|nr:hypothetical protein BC831DRAFT_446526 [Entophlyctis helioformis]
MKIIRVNDAAKFDAVLAETLAAAPGRVFGLFFGTEEPSTGNSWCPDCVIADPLVRKAIGTVANSTLIEAPAGLRSEYRANNPYRNHPEVKLVAVPTLVEFTPAGKRKQALIEAECARQDLLDTFIA